MESAFDRVMKLSTVLSLNQYNHPRRAFDDEVAFSATRCDFSLVHKSGKVEMLNEL
jgi:hypothetical protein